MSMYLRKRVILVVIVYGICYLDVIEGQVSLSTLLGTLRININSSFFGSLMVIKDPCFRSCERTYAIDFSLLVDIYG